MARSELTRRPDFLSAGGYFTKQQSNSPLPFFNKNKLYNTRELKSISFFHFFRTRNSFFFLFKKKNKNVFLQATKP